MGLSICGDVELSWHAVLCCGNKHCRLFCCDLVLDPMTFTYEHDPYCLEIHQMGKYKLPTSSLSTDIQTYIQTHGIH